jgi:hypothetical protein
MSRWTAALTVVVLTVALAACGSTAAPRPAQTATSTSPTSSAASALTGSLTPAQLREAVAVIKAWSQALRHGDITAAAGYFAVPSLFANAVTSSGRIVAATIRTAGEAREANETLSCGARFVSATRIGRYVDALFVLTARPGPGGTSCGTGIGTTARTDFLIENGKILAWIRAPGSAGVPTTPTTPLVTPTPGFTTPETTLVS